MLALLLTAALLSHAATQAQPVLTGRVSDQSGAALAGVPVALRLQSGAALATVTGPLGEYAFQSVPAGEHELLLRLINFAAVSRRVSVAGAPVREDVVMHLAVTSAVTVTGARTFRNLADAERPEESLVGIANSASAGAVTARQLAGRPVTRAAAILEATPGLVVSQHSGEGKASQYYLRGFNLDHGTDFATSVAGVPANLPTHAHGHGYTDLNFVIPELVAGIQYRKGPYAPDQGDFSAAGSAAISYLSRVDRPFASVAAGPFGTRRFVAVGSPSVGAGSLLYALEAGRNDGPWTQPEDHRRLNAVLRYTLGDNRRGVSVTAMGYRAEWNATDQVPGRAVASGSLSRYGSVDPSDRGETHRYSLSADGQWGTAARATHATAYLLGYQLRLFSNFTYFLDDPVNGDQFEQFDDRRVAGGQLTHRRLARLAGAEVEYTAGGGLRHDAIGTVGLYHTVERRRLSTVREDSAGVTAAGLFGQADITLAPAVRAIVGVRGDGHRFDVRSDAPVNTGVRVAGLLSPKLSLVVSPWRGTELYANAGRTFHSNDARGALTTLDPATGETADPATPLVPAVGYEAGVRSVAIPRTQLTAAWWTLRMDSELLFAGDAGATKAGRPSRRSGLEIGVYLSPLRWLHADADVSFSRARFADGSGGGAHIPGAVATVVSAGIGVDAWRGTTAAVRWRYIGPRPLVESAIVRSHGSHIATASARLPLTAGLRLQFDAHNLLDVRASDIDYFYVSRLPGEPAAGVADVHTHPVTPRTVLTSLVVSF